MASGVQDWLRRHQSKFHEEFHAFEGSPEQCTEGFCAEINPLFIVLREQNEERVRLEAANRELREALTRIEAYDRRRGGMGIVDTSEKRLERVIGIARAALAATEEPTP